MIGANVTAGGTLFPIRVARSGEPLAELRRTVLMLDGDEAGQRAANAIAERLANALEVEVIALQHGQ